MCACKISAQTLISGVVTDDRGPLVGANVFIVGTIDGALSDSTGHFSFHTDKTGEMTLRASFVGYEDFTLTATSLSNINIRMHERPTSIDEVVVAASNYSFGKSDNFKTMDALDVVLAGNSCGDIVAALQTLPGTQKVGEDNKLYVRGGESDECQTFVNGMHVLEPYTANVNNNGSRGRFSPFLFKGINFDGIKENVSKVFGESDTLNKLGDTISDVVKGKDKLTFSDMMNGGLLGKAMRKKSESQPAPEPKKTEPEKSEDGFGHSSRRIDQVTFGAYRKYACLALEERQDEAQQIFLNFVATLVPDQDLGQRQSAKINQKMAEIRQVVAQNQAIVMQKQQQLQAMQMETSRKIAANARAASDGIMDSWNKKMESDSRISQARSEATMGVNTYTNSYGQDVKVGVSADHVYENRYGDVYGVSGNALDQDVLNNLDWKEINKK